MPVRLGPRTSTPAGRGRMEPRGRERHRWAKPRGRTTDIMQSGKRNALLAIAVGGLIAGALDITQAIILFGKKVPLVIAAGLMVAPVRTFSEFSCTSLSPSRSRRFTTRPAAS